MTRRVFLVLGVALAGGAAMVEFVIEVVHRGFVADAVAANYVTLTFGVVVATLVVGVATARRSGWSGVGRLLVFAATGAAVGYFRFSSHPWESMFGFVVAGSTALLPLHAGVTHREGVPIPVRRMLVGAHATLTLCTVAMVVTAPAGALDRWFVVADSARYVRNPALIVSARGFAQTTQLVWWVVLITAATVAVAARYLQWRKTGIAARRSSAPVVAGCVVWTLLMVAAGLTVLLDRVHGARLVIADFGAVALPVVALGLLASTVGWVELVRPRLGRVTAGRIELGQVQPADHAAVQSLLADVLATPKVDVAFASESGWVDGEGHPFALEREKRKTTILARAGVPVAVIVHDPDVPFEAVELGARLAGAQLVARRATALARSRADAVRLATGRLVRAGDRASVEVSARLEARPLPMLAEVASGLRAGTATAAEAAAALRATTTEVRTLSHGLFPRDLDEVGLGSVLTNVGTPSRRLGAALEMTCYLLAHDDVGAVFIDVGHEIVVQRTRPAARELVERVEALGGTIDGTVATLPTDDDGVREQ